MTPTSEAHRPVRTCVGCGQRRAQAELLRVVLVDGSPVVERGDRRRAPGRGAWVCGPECVGPARKRRGFGRAWRTEVAPDVLDAIGARIEALHAS